MPVVVLIFFIVWVIVVVIYATRGPSDRNDISRWAAGQGYRIEKIEKTWFDNGPYWFRGRGRRMYRCRVTDPSGRRRTVYMRTGLFENDYEFYDPK